MCKFLRSNIFTFSSHFGRVINIPKDEGFIWVQGGAEIFNINNIQTPEDVDFTVDQDFADYVIRKLKLDGYKTFVKFWVIVPTKNIKTLDVVFKEYLTYTYIPSEFTQITLKKCKLTYLKKALKFINLYRDWPNLEIIVKLTYRKTINEKVLQWLKELFKQDLSSKKYDKVQLFGLKQLKNAKITFNDEETESLYLQI